MDHHYSLGLYTPTHVLYKLNETRNVLQKEDEHRALSNAGTKHDAHLSPKNYTKEFK